MTSLIHRHLCRASIEALHHYAGNDGLAPVCFALVDTQGDLLCFERMDGAPIRTINIAIAKAYTAARMGGSTKQFRQRLENENLLCSEFMDDALCALPGGVILPLTPHPFAAIGISGRSLDDDEKLALQLVQHLQTYFS